MICLDCDQVAQLQASYRQVLVEAEYLDVFKDIDRATMRRLVARAVLASAEDETLDSSGYVFDALDRLNHAFDVVEMAHAA